MSRGLEEIARWMISHGYATGHGDSIEDLLGELEAQARESKWRSSPKGAAASRLIPLPRRRYHGDPDCLHCMIRRMIQTTIERRGAGRTLDGGELLWAMAQVLADVRELAPNKERARAFEDEMIDQLTQVGFPVVRAGRA
jgi:hypothetical protein